MCLLEQWNHKCLGYEITFHFYTDKQGVHSHDVDVSAKTSTPSTTDEVMPYVQLLVCKKD